MFYLIFLAQAGIFCFYMTVENTNHNGASIGKIILGSYPQRYINGNRPMDFHFGFVGDEEEEYAPRVVPLTEVVKPVQIDGLLFVTDELLLNSIDLGPGAVTVTTKTPQILLVGSGGQFSNTSGNTLFYPEDDDRPSIVTTHRGGLNKKLLEGLAKHGMDATLGDIGRGYEIHLIRVPEIIVQGSSGQAYHLLPASQLVIDDYANPAKLLPLSGVVGKERAKVFHDNQNKSRKTTEVLQQLCMTEGDIAKFQQLHTVEDILANKYTTRGSSIIMTRQKQ